MAVMIPETPRKYEAKSKEGLMFQSLDKLPKEYYVVHSLKAANYVKGALLVREADFVIFNPDKGIIVMECKGGFPEYVNGEWRNGNGEPMEHDGPYRQAESGMHAIEKAIRNAGCEPMLTHCAMYYGVWFPSLTKENLRRQNLPPEADLTITLTMEDLADPLPAIERIFSIKKQYKHTPVEHKLNQSETHSLLARFICPQFKLVPTIMESKSEQTVRFHKLLDEQYKILEFLEDQPVAVINGAAGTGKTWVALEKARRHAEEGDEVLFLCYNKFLQQALEKKTAKYPGIHVYTIDGFACMICKTPEADYNLLNKKLQKMFMEDDFPYQHIIIDEGQDFGQKMIEMNGILQLLCDIVTADEEKHGTFYAFYDKLQKIQGDIIPKCIEEADCRLTLTRNCRNTENIAKTSLSPVTGREPRMFPLAIPGSPAKIAFCADKTEVVDKTDAVIAQLEEKGEKDIVILTCDVSGNTILADQIQNGKYKGKYPITTCRKFKGLEADNIILVDVDKTTFNENEVLLFYVGASRAKLSLHIISTLDEDACTRLLQKHFDYPEGKTISNPQGKLAEKLNALKMK